MALTGLDRFDPALRRRIATSATLGSLALADIMLGGWYFAAFNILMAFLMAEEWAELAALEDDRAVTLVRVAAAVAPAAAIAFTMEGELALGLGSLGLGVVLAAGFATLLPEAPVERAALGVVYIGLPPVCLVWLRNDPSAGFELVLWLLAVVWATDIAAYFVGRGVGGPRLAPSISPGKTWSGLAGGVLGAAATAWIVMLPGQPAWLAMSLGGVLALVAQGGDLFESYLKRLSGMKDSGRLLPGHGGLLDRVDGLIAAAPLFTAFWLVAGGA